MDQIDLQVSRESPKFQQRERIKSAAKWDKVHRHALLFELIGKGSAFADAAQVDIKDVAVELRKNSDNFPFDAPHGKPRDEPQNSVLCHTAIPEAISVAAPPNANAAKFMWDSLEGIWQESNVFVGREGVRRRRGDARRNALGR